MEILDALEAYKQAIRRTGECHRLLRKRKRVGFSLSYMDATSEDYRAARDHERLAVADLRRAIAAEQKENDK